MAFAAAAAVLGLAAAHPREVTLEEARAAWRKAILSAHPDKRAADEGADATDEVARVNRAWGVVQAALSGGGEGGGADAATVPVTEEVDSTELYVVSGGVLLAHACRCGEAYTLSREDLMAVPIGSSVILPCSGCSLHVRVTRTVP
jgi:hypothetical protein